MAARGAVADGARAEEEGRRPARVMGGRKRCSHDKLKYDCVRCNPCPHGRLKGHCADCNPCPHGKNKYKCAACKAAREGKSAPPEVKPDPEIKQEPFTIRGYFGLDK